MIKKIAFILCVGVLVTAFIKPGQLKNISGCKIVLDEDEFYPGNLTEISLLTFFKDSTQVSSQSSDLFTVNFSDYHFEISGGVSVQQKSRKSVFLQIHEDAYKEPYVMLSAELRRKGIVRWEHRIPIRYDVVQVVSYIGNNGYDPRSTTNSGYRQIPVTKRINIEFIDNEQTLSNNSDPKIIGGKGPDLEVYVSMITIENNKKMVKVSITDEFGDTRVKYLKPGVGQLEIQTIGGRGGISRSGGKGGNGGNVTVHIQPEARPYYDQIFIINHGGEGGDLWRPKIDGQQQGPYGDDGELVVLDWVE